VARVRERLPVNKQRSHRFNIERVNLKKLNEVEGKKQYRVEVSNRFATLEDLFNFSLYLQSVPILLAML
jgi:hypothetical protein